MIGRLVGRFFDDHRSLYVILIATALMGTGAGWGFAKLHDYLAVAMPSIGEATGLFIRIFYGID